MFRNLIISGSHYFAQSISTTCSYIIKPITYTCEFVYKNVLSDVYHLRQDIQHQTDFILGEGYKRAKENEDGVGTIYAINCGYVKLFPIMYVIANPDLVTQVTSSTDPDARKVFERLDKFTGYHSIVSMQDKEARPGRQNMLHNLNPSRDFKYIVKDLDQFLDAWNGNQFNERSYQNIITYFCANVIGKYVLGIPEISWDLIPTLEEANKAIVLEDPGSAEFKRIKQKFTSQTGTLFNKYLENILDANKKMAGQLQMKLKGDESRATQLEKLKNETDGLSAILAESNLSFACMGIAYVYQNPDILDLLRKVINEEKLLNPDLTYQALRQVPLLDQIWLEVLRFSTPTPLLARKTSQVSQLVLNDEKTEKTKNISIARNSYLFVPVRRLAHDSDYFENPELFNPQRFAIKDSKEIGVQKHIELFAFGSGPRACPAMKNKFAEIIFKLFLVRLCGQYDLQFTTPLTPIPVITRHSRFPGSLTVNLNPLKPDTPRLSNG